MKVINIVVTDSDSEDNVENKEGGRTSSGKNDQKKVLKKVRDINMLC